MFEIIIVLTAVAAVLGLLRAAALYRREHTIQPLLVVVRESDDNYDDATIIDLIVSLMTMISGQRLSLIHI